MEGMLKQTTERVEAMFKQKLAMDAHLMEGWRLSLLLLLLFCVHFLHVLLYAESLLQSALNFYAFAGEWLVKLVDPNNKGYVT